MIVFINFVVVLQGHFLRLNEIKNNNNNSKRICVVSDVIVNNLFYLCRYDIA